MDSNYIVQSNSIYPIVQVSNHNYQTLDELMAVSGRFDVFSLQGNEYPVNQSNHVPIQVSPRVSMSNQDVQDHAILQFPIQTEEFNHPPSTDAFPHNISTISLAPHEMTEESYLQHLRSMMKYFRHKVTHEIHEKINSKQGVKRELQPSTSESPIKRPRKNLSKDVVLVLKDWLEIHKENPYPDDNEKLQLMQQTKLSKKQVENWFVNARKRYLKAQDKTLSLVPPHIRQKQELASKLKEKMPAKEPLQQESMHDDTLQTQEDSDLQNEPSQNQSLHQDSMQQERMQQ